MKNNKKFLECTCLNEIIFLEKWEDESEELSIAMYKLQNYPKKLPFIKRFWLAVKVLFKGDLYHDNILLSKEQAVELKDWLSENYRIKQK